MSHLYQYARALCLLLLGLGLPVKGALSVCSPEAVESRIWRECWRGNPEVPPHNPMYCSTLQNVSRCIKNITEQCREAIEHGEENGCSNTSSSVFISQQVCNIKYAAARTCSPAFACDPSDHCSVLQALLDCYYTSVLHACNDTQLASSVQTQLYEHMDENGTASECCAVLRAENTTCSRPVKLTLVVDTTEDDHTWILVKNLLLSLTYAFSEHEGSQYTLIKYNPYRATTTYNSNSSGSETLCALRERIHELQPKYTGAADIFNAIRKVTRDVLQDDTSPSSVGSDDVDHVVVFLAQGDSMFGADADFWHEIEQWHERGDVHVLAVVRYEGTSPTNLYHWKKLVGYSQGRLFTVDQDIEDIDNRYSFLQSAVITKICDVLHRKVNKVVTTKDGIVDVTDSTFAVTTRTDGNSATTQVHVETDKNMTGHWDSDESTVSDTLDVSSLPFIITIAIGGAILVFVVVLVVAIFFRRKSAKKSRRRKMSLPATPKEQTANNKMTPDARNTRGQQHRTNDYTRQIHNMYNARPDGGGGTPRPEGGTPKPGGGGGTYAVYDTRKGSVNPVYEYIEEYSYAYEDARYERPKIADQQERVYEELCDVTPARRQSNEYLTIIG